MIISATFWLGIVLFQRLTISMTQASVTLNASD